MTREQFIALLEQKLSTTDINMVKADVEPFIINPHELDIWSNDYFLQVAKMMQFVD